MVGFAALTATLRQHARADAGAALLLALRDLLLLLPRLFLRSLLRNPFGLLQAALRGHLRRIHQRVARASASRAPVTLPKVASRTRGF